MKTKMTSYTALLLLTANFVFFTLNSNAQAPNDLFANRAGGTNDDQAFAITVDASGNTYMAGFFESSITFGTTTLTSAGNKDIFVVKSDASGNVLWAKRAGGSGGADKALSIVTDVNGNVFVGGTFDSPSISFGTSTLTNGGGGCTDIFIMKFDSSGNPQWAKSVGGTAFDYEHAVAVDANGNSYVVGEYGSTTIVAGTTTFSVTTGGSSNPYDIIIVKYDPSGNVLWAKSPKGSYQDFANSITVDSNNNTYVVGSFDSPTLNLGTTSLTNAGGPGGNPDLFIVKYDPSGNILWAQRGDDSYSGARSVTVDASDNVYVVGNFYGSSMTFGTINLINSNGNNDVFIVKYDASGTVLWAKSAGGLGQDFAYSVSVDANGNSYIAGSFESATMNFGTTSTLTNANSGGNSADIFIAEYDVSGNLLYAKSAGGVSDDYAYSVAVNTNNNAYAVGYFRSTSISFGNNTLTNASNVGKYDMFIVKLAAVLSSQPTISASGLILTSSSTTGNQWYLDGNIIPGATSQNYTATQNGDYTVIANGSAASAPYSITTITGIAENSFENVLKIYPNPTGGVINLQINQTKNTQIKIYNVLGECVYQNITSSSTVQIDLTSQSNGIYSIQVITAQGIENKEIVIVH